MNSRYQSLYGPFLSRDMCVSINWFGGNLRCRGWVVRLVCGECADWSGSGKRHSLESLVFPWGECGGLDKEESAVAEGFNGVFWLPCGWGARVAVRVPCGWPLRIF